MAWTAGGGADTQKAARERGFSMLARRKKSALLVDFENVVRPPDNSLVAKIPNWVSWLEAGEFDPERRRREFVSKRVYWNSHCEGNRPLFERQGFDAFACPAAAKDKKSAADIWIALDAIDLTVEFRNLEEIIIISTDTDFVPVVNRLREKKKEVVAVGNEKNLSSNVYALHADTMIPLQHLMRAVDYAPPKRGWFNFGRPKRTNGAAAPEPAPAPSPAPTPAPRTERRPAAQSFDHASAAELIVNAAKAQPGLFISRETVRNVLRGVPGFATSGKFPWLNCGSYCAMLKKFAALRTELEATQYPDGGCAIRYKKA